MSDDTPNAAAVERIMPDAAALEKIGRAYVEMMICIGHRVVVDEAAARLDAAYQSAMTGMPPSAALVAARGGIVRAAFARAAVRIARDVVTELLKADHDGEVKLTDRWVAGLYETLTLLGQAVGATE